MAISEPYKPQPMAEEFQKKNDEDDFPF